MKDTQPSIIPISVTSQPFLLKNDKKIHHHITLEDDSRTPNRLKLTQNKNICILVKCWRFGDTILRGGVTSSLESARCSWISAGSAGLALKKNFWQTSIPSGRVRRFPLSGRCLGFPWSPRAMPRGLCGRTEPYSVARDRHPTSTEHANHIPFFSDLRIPENSGKARIFSAKFWKFHFSRIFWKFPELPNTISRIPVNHK
mgnify:CR=1 FL=1